MGVECTAKTYVVGEPILINVILTNPTNTPIHGYSFPTHESALTISLENSSMINQGVWLKPKPQIEDMIGSVHNVSAYEPQSSHEEKYYLTHYAIISKPLTVALLATVRFAIVSNGGEKVIILTCPFNVTTTASDGQYLKDRLEALSNSIATSTSVQVREDHIRELCSYTTSQAVPYLDSIFKRERADGRQQMLSSLTSNSSIGAAALKQFMIGENDARTIESIRSALKEIGSP